jgi:hypothetical protein
VCAEDTTPSIKRTASDQLDTQHMRYIGARVARTRTVQGLGRALGHLQAPMRHSRPQQTCVLCAGPPCMQPEQHPAQQDCSTTSRYQQHGHQSPARRHSMQACTAVYETGLCTDPLCNVCACCCFLQHTCECGLDGSSWQPLHTLIRQSNQQRPAQMQ